MTTGFGAPAPWDVGNRSIREILVSGGGLPTDTDVGRGGTVTLPTAPAGGLRGLAAWYAAVGNRDIAAAKVLFMGDSITEGTGASTWANRTISKFEAKMRALYPTPGVIGGAGYIPATTAFAPVPPVTVTDGATGHHASAITNADGGLGMKTLSLWGNNTPSSGAVASWGAITCDRYRVWYTQPDAFAQNGDVLLDGATVTTLTGTNTPYRGGQVYDSGAITPGSHTVTIRGDGAFAFNVEAVEFFNGDWNKGIHAYDGAHFGFNTSDFFAFGPDRSHWSAVATLQPQLVIVNLGTIDVGAVAPATYLANVDTILGRIATANTGIDYSVLWALPYKPANTQSNPAWEDYRAGLLARRSDKVEVLDLNASWPILQMDGSMNKGLMSEASNPIHPSDAGHDHIAGIYARAVSTSAGAAVDERKVTTSTATATTTVESVVLRLPVAAGRFRLGDILRYSMWLTPAATTVTTVRVRIGTTGTTSDASVIVMSATASTNAGARLAFGQTGITVAGASATHIGGGTEQVGAITAAGTATSATSTFNSTVANYVTVTVQNTSSTTTTVRSGVLEWA